MTDVQTRTVTTKVPARLDRRPWSRWHWMVVVGLGTAYLFGRGALSAATLTAHDAPDSAGVPHGRGDSGHRRGQAPSHRARTAT